MHNMCVWWEIRKQLIGEEGVSDQIMCRTPLRNYNNHVTLLKKFLVCTDNIIQAIVIKNTHTHTHTHTQKKKEDKTQK